jgi:bifunctional aspartokinase / homoserine dehydrogenase 1
MTPSVKDQSARAGLPSRAAEFFSEPQQRSVPGRFRSVGKKPLRVMKFGGTSVGDASCIARVVEIIRSAAWDSDVVVVVSAMKGVTNQLVAAARESEAGHCKPVAAIFEELRQQHETAARALIHSTAELSRVEREMTELLQAGDRLCQGTILLRELTPRTRDAISSLGERLSVLLVAAALAERGVPSAAIEATELVVTDACHGAAEPCMDLTREHCDARLRPLLRQGMVPVVTGFIGSTADGVLTTLGRGGSDYSATIVGAALEADEVIIWTDVDGLHTADPRLVPNACTIPEVSYREAAELAYFGAKVLHPKTLRPVVQSGVPLWIRNTFAPERMGTKITPAGPPSIEGVTALTAISDVVMLTVGGPGLAEVQDVLGRAYRATAAVRADVLLISQASSQNDLCLVIPSAFAKTAVEALRHEFAHDLAHQPVDHITLDSSVAMVTVVGQNLRSAPAIVGRGYAALGRERVHVVAIAQGSSEFTFSFVVAKPDMNTALASLHREFRLGSLPNRTISEDGNRHPHCSPARVDSLPQEQPTSGKINSPIEEYLKPSLSLAPASSDVHVNQ